ncbi:hypothetical protein EGR_11256 [Echinococcus granulosus]|uniref:WGR domain-containing protein n=1 Tax=Echinococcus granulosus TaxID=6210 RepID=W6TYN3_ECHGR|nr:hypothetical protein EGR_11256 [Echinococcus granulosus]EUB53890.1 hypothetical protein EGR_11256 [Echinococcus granulosus]
MGTAITVRLQVLCSEESPRQHRVLRAWGRIGMRIGGLNVGRLVSLHAATQRFHDLFLKRIANSWGAGRANFVKLQRRIFLSNWNKLTPRVICRDFYDHPISLYGTMRPELRTRRWELIHFLFDIALMTDALLEFGVGLDS